MNKKTWLITRSQITAGDVERAILPFDPEQILNDEIVQLRGTVRLRIENARGMADVITDPASRRFFRALHKRWPWSAFFLRIKPIHANSAAEEIVDLSVFMSFLWVHVDELTYVETAHSVVLNYDAHQFHGHFVELQTRAAQLAAAVGMSPALINERAALISRALTTFFEVGQQLDQKPAPPGGE